MMGLTDLLGYPESKGGGVTGRVILEFTLKKILPQILMVILILCSCRMGREFIKERN
jgi:hypothetical protein